MGNGELQTIGQLSIDIEKGAPITPAPAKKPAPEKKEEDYAAEVAKLAGQN